MNCSEAKLRLEPYAAGGLAAEDKPALEEHLSMCEACRLELELRRAIQGTPSLVPTLDLGLSSPAEPAPQGADAPPALAAPPVGMADGDREVSFADLSLDLTIPDAPAPAAGQDAGPKLEMPGLSSWTEPAENPDFFVAPAASSESKRPAGITPSANDAPSAAAPSGADWGFEPIDTPRESGPPHGSVSFAKETLTRKKEDEQRGRSALIRVALWGAGAIAGLALLGISIWVAMAVREEPAIDSFAVPTSAAPSGATAADSTSTDPAPLASTDGAGDLGVATTPSALPVAPPNSTPAVDSLLVAAEPTPPAPPAAHPTTAAPAPAPSPAPTPAKKSANAAKPPANAPKAAARVASGTPKRASATSRDVAPSGSAAVHPSLAAPSPAAPTASAPTPSASKPAAPPSVAPADPDAADPYRESGAPRSASTPHAPARVEIDSAKNSTPPPSGAEVRPAPAIQTEMPPFPPPSSPSASTPPETSSAAGATPVATPNPSAVRPIDRLRLATETAVGGGDLAGLRKLKTAWRNLIRAGAGPDRARAKREYADCLWAIQEITGREADQREALVAYRDFVLYAPAGGVDARSVSRMRFLEDLLAESN